MEIILSLIAGFAFGYWRGVLSGYDTGIRERLLPSIINIEIEEVDKTFLYYELESGKFLGQWETEEIGNAEVLKKYDGLLAEYGSDEKLTFVFNRK